ncbi:MAG: hypothetical protein RMM51_08860, partial [Verrucomicrobiae bacterium]|nr:hypothetical protein [Verrucomicrobiae bacterium]
MQRTHRENLINSAVVTWGYCRTVGLLVVSLEVVLMMPCCGVVQASEWVEHTKTYEKYGTLGSFGLSPGDTLTDILESDDFPFEPTPGNFEVIINSASFDDKGQIGGIESSDGSSCRFRNVIPTTRVPDSAVQVVGRRLRVDISATDDAHCAGHIGWPYGVPVSITWRAKCADACAQGACEPGALSAGLGSVNVSIALGRDRFGQSAGQLAIRAELPGATLAQPAGLQVFLGAGAERITDEFTGALRQVRTSQVLADIVANNAVSYQIRFYTADSFTTNRVSGVYQPNGSPFQIITVENPDTNTVNKLRISSVGQLGEREYQYEYFPTENRWELSRAYGLVREFQTVHWIGDTRIVTQEVREANGTLVMQQVEKYRVFPWGATNLVERIADPAGAALTNRWVYYEDPSAGHNYKRLRYRIEPTGRWEKYEYDNAGRIIKIVKQFTNAAIDAPEDQCLVVYWDYWGNWVRRTEFLQGHWIRWEETWRTPSSRTEWQFTDMWGASILETITTWHTNGLFESQPRSIRQPDGTWSLFHYAVSADGLCKITTNDVGAGTGSAITNGTRTITVTDLAGRVLTNETYDIASGLLVARSVVLTTDPLGRPTSIADLTGTNSTTYACCGAARSVDTEGIVTEYEYDPLGRQVAVRRAGVFTEYTYDAAGRMIAVWRNGTLISSNRYDLAGRLISTTDALGQTTTFAESFNENGELVKTTTYPDGSTRVETYYQDGQLKSITGTAVHGVRYEYGVAPDEDGWRRFSKEIKLSSSGQDTAEWTKTFYDMLDRPYKVAYPDASFSRRWYNTKGQLWKERDPDGVVTLYGYNDRGEREITAVDINHNDVIDFEGHDRITIIRSSVLQARGVTVRRTTTIMHTTDGAPATEIIAIHDASFDGSQAWHVEHGLTNHTATTIHRPSATKTILTTAPDGSYTVSIYTTGRLVSVSRFDALHTPIERTTYEYDPAGRQKSQSNSFGDLIVTTAFVYDQADQLIAITNAVGLPEQQVTRYVYDSRGRRIQTILPDGATQFIAYYRTGEIATNWGARTYPVAYTYDYAGRLKTMTTWKHFATQTGPATTTWNYDPQRGFLTAKVYADQSSVTYTYTPAGRLARRTWARGVTTDYSYNAAGELARIEYSDATPDIAFTYDRRGRRVAVTNGNMVATFTYNAAGQMLTESFPHCNLTITNIYDSLLRREWLLADPANLALRFEHDAASRLRTVAAGPYTATYTYQPHSSRVSHIVLAHGTNPVLRTTKTYDALSRLQQVDHLTPNPDDHRRFLYHYNLANQRTRRTHADGSYWEYTYDPLGQVLTARNHWPNGTPVLGQHYQYHYDDIGNRTDSAVGLPPAISTYTA